MKHKPANGHGASAVYNSSEPSDDVVESVHMLYWAAKTALDVLGDSIDRETFAPVATNQLRKALRAAEQAGTLDAVS